MTHRGVSTHFTVVTGHEDPAKGRTDVDWEALARAGGTLVILMGAGHISEIARRLIDGGRAPDTPVAAVRNGTRADQRTVRATLATIADAGVRAPSAIVVGEVAALDLSWFEDRPLFGRSVVVTAAASRRASCALRLEQLGAEVLELPAIAIEPIDVTLPELSTYEWLVFTSRQRRRRVLRARASQPRVSTPVHSPGVRVAAIGPGHRARAGRARSSRRPRARALRGRSRCSRRSRRPTAPEARVLHRPRREGARRPSRGPGRSRVRGRRAPRVPHGARRRPTPPR